MKKSMAIVQSTDYASWPLGGTRTYMLNILSEFEEEYNIELWGVSVSGRKSEDQIEISGRKYRIHYFAQLSQNRKIIPNILKEMIGAYQNGSELCQYDIVFFHSPEALLMAEMKMKKKRPFVVYIQHGLNYLSWKKGPRRCCAEFLSPRAERLANVNFLVTDVDSFDKYMGSMKFQNSKCFHQVGSPIDYDAINANNERKESEHPRFVFTGRIADDKRPEIAIQAMSEYIQHFDDKATLEMIGGGANLEKCKKQIEDLHLENNVFLLGALPREEVILHLFKSDIAIHPSVGEGMSLSLLEDLAAGLPVVAFEVTGIINLIENDINGYMAPDGNISKFVNNMHLAYINKTRLAEKARSTAKEYDKLVVSRYLIDTINSSYDSREQQ